VLPGRRKSIEVSLYAVIVSGSRVSASIRRVPLVLCCAVLVLLTGFGGTNLAGKPGRVSVQIEVVKTVTSLVPSLRSCKEDQVVNAGERCDVPTAIVSRITRSRQSFSLTCNPTGGTLPLAARVCEDIRRYPTTMLNPPPPQPYPGHAYHVCSGTIVASTTMTISARASGKPSTFTGQVSGCFSTSPPYDGLLIYDAASSGNKAALAALEQGLR
jgi:hypothetical protein